MYSIFCDFADSNFFSSILALFIACNLILLVTYVLLNYRLIVHAFKISNKSLSLVLLIFILALSLRICLPPFIHEDFYNEWEYMEGAQSMISNGMYSNCSFGDLNECFQSVVPKHPPGVPLILSIPFMFFGATDEVAINTNIFFGSASVVLIFLLGYLLSNKESIGLFSAFFFSLIPMHIKYSGTVLLGPISVFFQMLTVLAFMLSLRINKKSMWFLFFISLSYTLQTRPEIVVLMILFVSGYFIIKPDTLRRINISWHHFLVILLLLPHLVHMVSAVSAGSWKEGKEIPSFSLFYALRNFIPYTLFWFKAGYQLHIFPFLFIFGSFYLLRSDKKVLGFLILWITLFHGFFTPYHLDPLTTYASFRYMLSVYVPFCLLAAYGVNVISNFFSYFTLIVIVLTLISFYPHIPYITYKELPRQIEMDLMKEVEHEIDGNCYVIGQPSLFSIHKKIIYPDILIGEANGYNKLRSVTDCLYLYKDLSAMDDNWADQILSECPGEIITSRDVQLIDGSTFTFAFYKLNLDQCPE